MLADFSQTASDTVLIFKYQTHSGANCSFGCATVQAAFKLCQFYITTDT